ncbi:alpha/beta fold hydrolase [Dactylosporangium siamense]|uniref:Alpha/beta hydrolase n=1 Tax=Dactylosporangium siamense TaxID=685454 RepID=A0A919PIT8_9ACTN|nr:alpha/beta hydrolase [Dactylosporangium siamense]GIG44016.1 alpha/beta hydrolase [Dactylosporangium siamense]
MNSAPTSRRTVLTGLATVSAAAGLGIVTSAAPAQAETFARPAGGGTRPTVVLVHGAFADASGWNGTVQRLQDGGYPVVAVANPLRALASDAAYVAAVLASITGPVILVGHSYGGAVITNAATGNPNVKALVYIAAFAPDEGESAFALSAGGTLQDVVASVPVPIPGGGTDVELSIRPQEFRKAFISEVGPATALALAATQRPVTLTALGSPSGPPAWRSIPSWYAVSGADQAIPPASQRAMAKRAGAHTVEVPRGSHAYFVTHPDVVVDLVRAATRATVGS